MFRTYHIFSIRDLPVRIHGLTVFLLLLVFAQFQGSAPFLQALALSAVIVVLLLGSITLHELGHILVGRRYGIDTRDIILSPIGGVARMMGIPDNPHHEIRIALAGPLVSLLLAGLCYLLTYVIPQNPTTVFFLYAGIMNLGLFLFNLLPAFPMDGGRVLRGVLTQNIGFEKATELVAGTVTKFMCIAFGLWGLLQGRFMLIVLAVAVYSMAVAEARTVKLQAMQRQMFGTEDPRTPDGGDFFASPPPYAQTSAKPPGSNKVLGFVRDVFGSATDLFSEAGRFVRG